MRLISCTLKMHETSRQAPPKSNHPQSKHALVHQYVTEMLGNDA